MDICTYDSAEHMRAFELKTLKSNSWHIPSGDFRRFRIPMGPQTAGDIEVSVIGKRGFDLPAVNPAYAGRKYQYVCVCLARHAFPTHPHPHSQGATRSTPRPFSPLPKRIGTAPDVRMMATG